MPRITVFGEVLFDCFPGGEQVLGGAPFNVAWHLQAFGQRPRFVSRVGEDEAGRRIRRAMSDWGMDTDDLQRDPRHATGQVQITFSGGEPTQQSALPEAIREVRALGFEIGLHTSGVYPERLARLLPLLDWVGLDIKALPEDYPALTGMPGSGRLAWRSAELLTASGTPCQLRTTHHPALMDEDRRHELQARLQALNPADHRWQVCRTDHCLDPRLSAQSAPGPIEVG